YGGIQRWASADGTLTFELDEAAADTLGLDPTVTIALPADASVNDITAGLRRVVAGET
ncbi:MAG: hypothetical protein QOK10_2521, partial [Pseudonocardiales bacterium]|nr:hypothetical protein [Pseudonocardiales bacterium]